MNSSALSEGPIRVEGIEWVAVHSATKRLDDRGELVLGDGAGLDWHLLRCTDSRFEGEHIRLNVLLRPTETCSTCFYVHHWGSRDICSIDRHGNVVLNEGTDSIDVEAAPDGFLKVVVVFRNNHPTLSIGTGSPRGWYTGSGTDQFVIRSIEVEIVPAREAPFTPRNATRKMCIDRLWHGRDPFHDFAGASTDHDLQGWNSQHAYLADAIDALSPEVIVEIGVWKGSSTRFMVTELGRRRLNSVVIAVDTWLGSSEHWLSQSDAQLRFVNGRPTLYDQFLSNMIRERVTEFVVPLPLDSLNAAEVLKRLGVSPAMIHLDGGHDFGSVMADLAAWWPLLAPGGVLIGDDYFVDEIFPGVREAFDEYFGALQLTPLEHIGGKCRVAKPG